MVEVFKGWFFIRGYRGLIMFNDSSSRQEKWIFFLHEVLKVICYCCSVMDGDSKRFYIHIGAGLNENSNLVVNVRTNESATRVVFRLLYYDLSEKLTKRGSMVEALVYARKAEGLRAKLFSEYFDYATTIERHIVAIDSMHIHSSMAIAASPYDRDSSNTEDYTLSPWNVLRYYLESKLQLLNPTNFSKDDQGRLCSSLVDVRCLHALCTQEETPDFKDPALGKSSFSNAFIYYDLVEKLMTRGYMAEALVYARKAKSVCAKFFKEYFSYTTTTQGEIHLLSGLSSRKHEAIIESFQIKDPMVVACWPFDEDLSKIDDYILTPWNVLRCYLESLLQVGTILEIHGNRYKTSVILKWGHQIAFLQHLPIFSVSFSAVLEKLYGKHQLWELTDRELKSAERNLFVISCEKCKLLLGATVYQQRGDFCRSRFLKTDIGRSSLTEIEKFYMLGRTNLEHITWKNSVSNSKEQTASSTPLCDASFTSENVVRTTTEHSGDRKKCWHCLASTVNTSLRSVIYMEWECVRRRILLGLLIGTGKCFQMSGETLRRNTFPLPKSSISLPVAIN